MNWQATTKRPDWATPRAFFEMACREFGLTMDACSGRNNPTTAETQIWADEHDSLTMPWKGRVWCNPPYGREIGKWVAKAAREVVRRDGPELVVMLLPARTDTSWWHEYCMRAEVRFIRGRLCFDDNRRNSALVIFRRASEEKP